MLARVQGFAPDCYSVMTFAQMWHWGNKWVTSAAPPPFLSWSHGLSYWWVLFTVTGSCSGSLLYCGAQAIFATVLQNWSVAEWSCVCLDSEPRGTVKLCWKWQRNGQECAPHSMHIDFSFMMLSVFGVLREVIVIFEKITYLCRIANPMDSTFTFSKFRPMWTFRQWVMFWFSLVKITFTL